MYLGNGLKRLKHYTGRTVGAIAVGTVPPVANARHLPHRFGRHRVSIAADCDYVTVAFHLHTGIHDWIDATDDYMF